MKKKGICTHDRIFYGMVTVSDKGQIAIPIDLRRDLDIGTGSKLIVMKRKDDSGIVLLKVEKMDRLMDKIREDESFFEEEGD
ncbi:MAG: hypothetical protein A7316_02325 [Candidatus Altiarchaeales archaeon WOR_SM1_86-2]|nr:MAG: hypothetical protein A7316_02325 [Candidatus Altiarchaeales archaeon WOR_SM1_86-2]